MGRNPLVTRITAYLDKVRLRFSPTTFDNKRYILLAFARRYNGIRRNHPEKSLVADPIKWREKEILEMLELMKTGVDGKETYLSSQVQMVGIVEGFLTFIGNPIVAQVKRDVPQRFPHRQETQIKPHLNMAQVERLRQACKEIPGWRGTCAGFLVVAYSLTGPRRDELRKARRKDLDVTNPNPDEWTLEIAFPKANRIHGRRKVPIPEPLRPDVATFLRERAKKLSELGLTDTPDRPLVFSLENPEGPWSQSTIGHLNEALREKTGIQFTTHTLRRTYGQLLLNQGASLEAVSPMMGHSSTVVTERYYCRKDADQARIEVLRSFARPSAMAQSTKNPLISGKSDYTGYA